MRVPRWLLLASLSLLAAGLLSSACGDSGDDRESTDLSKIPTATPPNPLPDVIIVGEVAPSVEGATYIVQAGDSPASIAAQFGSTADAIMEANGITDPATLGVGQVLTIPGVAPIEAEVLPATAAPASTPAAEPQQPEPEDQTVYIVQAGDIPETIAEQFGITADALMAANRITDPTSLDIGQELVIPNAAPTATPEP